MTTKIRLLVGVALLAVIGIVFWQLNFSTPPTEEVRAIPTADPIDAVLDFYNEWSAVLASSTEPFTSELFNSTQLSDSLRTTLRTAKESTPDIDPITCQTGNVQSQFRIRSFPASETEVKLLVESRIDRVMQPQMAFVTVEAVAGEWQLTAIECTAGDIAPVVEFNYDREGFLLKSVPPPFETGTWHLVFEQDGQMGHVTPLFFSGSSTCVTRTGESAVCNPDSFVEATPVKVKGGMTELGAEVVRVEFLQ